MGLRRTLRKLLGYKEPEQYLNASYAQEGEDMIIDRIFEHKKSGFFVDVGALHPVRFSNTYKFYKMGWRGINIDALPGSMAAFDQLRPLDINLEIPVSDKSETLQFYVFNEPALNTFSKEMADERNAKPEYNIEKVIDLKTQGLSDILNKHLPEGTAIDFLTIDAEGFDFQILQSNDWNKFRPSIVLLETDISYAELLKSDINSLLANYGYELYAKTVKTCFFKHKSLRVPL